MRLRFNPDKFLKPDRSIPTAVIMIALDSGFLDHAHIFLWPNPYTEHMGISEAVKIVLGLYPFNTVPVWESITNDFAFVTLLGTALILFIFGLFFRYFNFSAVLFWFSFLLSNLFIRVLAGNFFDLLPDLCCSFGLFAAYCLFRMTEFERKKRTPKAPTSPAA